jgi:site-specific DNA-methyltransferase (adenine-specific)
VAIHLFNEDCLSWLQRRESESIHAVVTDPPFSVEDFDPAEVGKLRSGSGGVWRQPPTLSGSRRAPVPRFTVLSAADQQKAYAFFVAVATELYRCLVPGAHVFIATTPTLSHLVYLPLLGTGFEKRGEIIRLVQTL